MTQVEQRKTGHSARDGKIALVLAGGGITGAVYELGALRAIEDLLVDLTVNDFDIYVGTSAGALICSLLANGFTPHEIIQLIDDRHPELRGIRVGDVLRVNMEGMVRRVAGIPGTLFRIWFHALTRWHEMAISDVVWELTNLLPAGLYNGDSLERYVRAILAETGGSNRFDELTRELFVVATTLDTGKRAIFGPGHAEDVAISQAVAASSAVPLLYRPVQIGNRDYVDGGLHGAASLDLAIEAGAKLVVCVNSMVPLDTSKQHPDQHYVRQHGFQAIINQTVRTFMHSTVRYHVKNLRTKHPDVDIILIQPDADDYAMFAHSPMYYRSRLVVAEHGFATVTRGLQANADYFRTVLARHGIRIAEDLAVEELSEMEQSDLDPSILGQVIAHEEPTAKAAGKDVTKLDRSLHRRQTEFDLAASSPAA